MSRRRSQSWGFGLFLLCGMALSWPGLAKSPLPVSLEQVPFVIIDGGIDDAVDGAPAGVEQNVVLPEAPDRRAPTTSPSSSSNASSTSTSLTSARATMTWPSSSANPSAPSPSS